MAREGMLVIVQFEALRNKYSYAIKVQQIRILDSTKMKQLLSKSNNRNKNKHSKKKL